MNYVIPKEKKKHKLFMAICEKINKEPQLWDVVLCNFEHQKKNHSLSNVYKERLEVLFNKGRTKSMEILTSISDEGHDLRQVAPLWGIISEKERMEILRSA